MRRIRLSQDFGRILKVPPKLVAGSRQNSQAGGLRYVAQPSRLRVRGASEPHVPSHREPTDGGTIKMRPADASAKLPAGQERLNSLDVQPSVAKENQGHPVNQ